MGYSCKVIADSVSTAGVRLTTLEMGPQDFDFVGYFRFLEKHGYVEFLKR